MTKGVLIAHTPKREQAQSHGKVLLLSDKMASLKIELRVRPLILVTQVHKKINQICLRKLSLSDMGFLKNHIRHTLLGSNAKDPEDTIRVLYLLCKVNCMWLHPMTHK